MVSTVLGSCHYIFVARATREVAKKYYDPGGCKPRHELVTIITYMQITKTKKLFIHVVLHSVQENGGPGNECRWLPTLPGGSAWLHRRECNLHFANKDECTDDETGLRLCCIYT